MKSLVPPAAALAAVIAAAVAVVGSFGIAAAADAQTPPQAPTGYYVAVPATQPTADHLVTRTAAWRLTGNAYIADQAPERPQILCQLVAGKTGALTSFSVKGTPLAADKLAACNAKAAK